jgi:hypothetical protein
MASKEFHNDLSISGRLGETAEGVSVGLIHGAKVILGIKEGPEMSKYATELAVEEHNILSASKSNLKPAIKELLPFSERKCKDL